MLISNGYSLVYYKNLNQIVVGLPQTSKTLTNTFQPVVDRRVDVEEIELAILLNVTQAIFLNGAKMDEYEWQEPEIPYINPCRGCDDYDGQGGCKSNGGCGTWIKMDEVTDGSPDN